MIRTLIEQYNYALCKTPEMSIVENVSLDHPITTAERNALAEKHGLKRKEYAIALVSTKTATYEMSDDVFRQHATRIEK